MYTNDESYLDSLKQQLFIDSSSWFGLKTEQVNFIDRIDRRYSYIIRAVIQFQNQSVAYLVIKIPRDPSMIKITEVLSSEKIKREGQLEADVLGKIYQRIIESGDNSLAAIKVFGYYPEYGAIIMEELRMRLLKEDVTGIPMFLLSNKNWDEFISNVSKSSVWLSLFHDSSQVNRDVELSATEVFNDVQNALTRLEKTSGLELTDLRKRFDRQYELIKNMQVRIGYLHNDFHLGNVFITTEGKVGAFDPNLEARGPVCIDVARLMIDLETRRPQILSFGKFFSHLRIDKYKKTVLRGYFKHNGVSLPLINYFCALELIKKWRVNEEFFVDKNLKHLEGLKPALMYWTRRYFYNLICNYI